MISFSRKRDTGLVCYLTKWSSPETLQKGAMNGAILENYAISEILKGFQNRGQAPYSVWLKS